MDRAMSHGIDSAFIKEVAIELAEVEGVQKQRGSAGAALKHWGDRPVEESEGKIYASRIFEGLRALAAFGENWADLASA